MGRLTEIDAVRRNIAPVLAALEVEAEDGGETDTFNTTLDALVESRNISLGQIAAVGDLIALAFRAGLQAR